MSELKSILSSTNISVTFVCAVEIQFKHDLPTHQSDFVVSVYGKAFWHLKMLGFRENC